MKRCLKWILAFCILFSVASAQVELRVDSVSDAKSAWINVSVYNITTPIAAYQATLTFDPNVIRAEMNSSNFSSDDNTDNTLGFFNITYFTTSQYISQNGTILFSVYFNATRNDGSVSYLNLTDVVLGDEDGKELPYITINGTFKTLDEMPPTITFDVNDGDTISGPEISVNATFYDLSGFQSNSLKVWLNNTQVSSDNVTVLKIDDTTWKFWIQPDVTKYGFTLPANIKISVSANDTKGNTGNAIINVTVVESGFVNPSPSPGSFLNYSTVQIRADFVNIRNDTIKVFVNDSDVTGSCSITSGTSGNVTCSLTLSEGLQRVKINGTDVEGREKSLEWSFTIDLTPPEIEYFSVEDSDGDGFIEAWEQLKVSWNVTDENFGYVMICDEFKCINSYSSNSTTSWQSEFGNQSLKLIAYDKAGNSNEGNPVHIYNNYVAYIDSEIGKIGDLSLNKTATLDLMNLSISKVEVFATRNICSPSYSKIEREASISGTLPKNTTVKLDSNANATITESYRCVPVYDVNSELNFKITAPMVKNAVVLLIEANNSSIKELIENKTRPSLKIGELLKYHKYIYLFGNAGWAKIKINSDGSITQSTSTGTISINTSSIMDTLRKNQVNLSTGFVINSSLQKPQLDAGEYALVAIAIDGDRLGLVAGYPIIVPDSSEDANLNSTKVDKNGSIKVSFSQADYIMAVVVKNETYAIKAKLNYSGSISADMAELNFTSGNQPLKQLKFQNYELPVWYPENYATMSVKKANNTTVSLANMPYGDYILYAVSIKNGRVYAISQHDVRIIAPDLNVTAISIIPAQPIANQQATINATIANIGEANAGTFNVSFYANNSLIGKVSISGLNAGGSIIASISWTPSSAGSYVIRVVADSDNNVAESDEGNNESSTTVTVFSPPVTTPAPRPPVGGGAGGGAVISGVPIYISPYEFAKANEFLEIKMPYEIVKSTGVISITVIPSESVNLRVRVERLKELPSDIPSENLIIVIPLKIDLILSKETEVRGYIDFFIERSEIKERGFDPDNVIVTMLKWDGKQWVRLKTDLTGKDDKYNYYRAEVSSFSYFAVILESPKPTPTPTTPTPTPPPTTPIATTPTVTPTPPPTLPGMEIFASVIVVAILVIAAIAYFLKKRRK
ncbi:MAG: CARDB domain-containing protein [Archaeoglobaceae archaeon]